MLVLYNSATRRKESFVPIVAGKIGLYVCGMTVYDLCHLGHGRAMVCFDVIVRFLRQEGYEVTFVRNITDIDDKIIKRAAEKGVSIQQLTTEYIAAMHADAKALGTLMPDREPCATSHINEIIALIQRLLDKGYAYITTQGDICYEVSKFQHYAKLSKQDIAALMLGARIAINEDKRSALDFVLWKTTKTGEPSWPSPWGPGRPGWHIECSAMAMHQLGEEFDIHGGGLDLQFPHHDNEIAQSEAATGHPYARYWLHVGMLQVNDEKMAKSTGNFYTIRDVLKLYHPEVVRYFLLSNHYRSSLNYTTDAMLNASKALMRLYQTLRGIDYKRETQFDTQWIDLFRAAMCDDFNTPVALSVLFDLSHEVNKNPSTILAATLGHLGGRLGLLQEAPAIFLQQVITGKAYDLATITHLIDTRNAARCNKNWALADEIRQELLKNGIELEDTSHNTTWRRRLD